MHGARRTIAVQCSYCTLNRTPSILSVTLTASPSVASANKDANFGLEMSMPEPDNRDSNTARGTVRDPPSGYKRQHPRQSTVNASKDDDRCQSQHALATGAQACTNACTNPLLVRARGLPWTPRQLQVCWASCQT
jgi:hypothetical protein